MVTADQEGTMNSEISFGRWLKERRKALDLTQYDFARRIGCAIVTIRKIESDQRRPSTQLAELMAEQLELSADERKAFLRFARIEPNSSRLTLPGHTDGVVGRLIRRQIILPSPLTPLIGRDLDVVDVAGRVLEDDVRLLTLLGPPGVGKTRLGIQVARSLSGSFADGVCFVALAPVQDAELVAAAIAQTLGLAEMGSLPLRLRLIEALEDKRLLLLLDNFEQVVGSAPLVADLLAACPHLKILVTSRSALRVSGEEVFTVQPLALPDLEALPGVKSLAHCPSVALFVARAQAAKPNFVLTATNAESVAAICVQVDGLPLAIELVAVYVKVFAPPSLLMQLSRRLKQSGTSARDLPPRQQTLWNAIGWSYDLLNPGEQRLFERLAVFAGGCTLEAIETICNADGDLEIDVMDGLLALLEKSLLYQEDGANEEPRFIMLHTIREYGLERLTVSGTADIFQRRHAHFFLALAELAEPFLRGPRQEEWLARLDLEHDNMRAALAWSRSALDDATLGLRLAGALWWFWFRRGHMNEGRHWIEGALAQTEALGRVAMRAQVLHAAGVFTWLQGDYALAKDRLQESLAIWRELDDKRGLAHAMNYLGMVVTHQDEATQARSLHEESLALFQVMQDAWGVALALRNLGMVARVQGDAEGASALYEQSLRAFRDVRDKWGLIVVLNGLGEIGRSQGHYDRAAALYEESLALSRQVRDKWLSAMILHNLAHVAQHQGVYEQASALIEESLRLWRDLGNKPGMALCLFALAGVAIKVGNPKQAVRLFGAAEALFERKVIRTAFVDQAEYTRNLAAARAELDEVIFAALWAEGKMMTLEEVTASAWIHQRDL
jgi:predicted ATPase/transcriptional regulator with XRE-family HTH domain